MKKKEGPYEAVQPTTLDLLRDAREELKTCRACTATSTTKIREWEMVPYGEALRLGIPQKIQEERDSIEHFTADAAKAEKLIVTLAFRLVDEEAP